MRVGDRILQINGHDMRNATQTDFTNTLKQCNGGSFTLQIEYDVTTHGWLIRRGVAWVIFVIFVLEGLEETQGSLMVELQKPDGASLGISLRGMILYSQCCSNLHVHVHVYVSLF